MQQHKKLPPQQTANKSHTACTKILTHPNQSPLLTVAATRATRMIIREARGHLTSHASRIHVLHASLHAKRKSQTSKGLSLIHRLKSLQMNFNALYYILQRLYTDSGVGM